MRKLIFLLMAVAILTTSVAFAQQTRSLKLYLDANSGNMIKNASPNGNGLFDGNEFEFGAIYLQNFASAEWLSFRLRMRAIVNQRSLYDDGDEYLGLNPNSPFKFNRVDAQAGLILNSEALGFDGLYMGLYVDTRTLVAFETSYTLGFGAAGSLTFGTVVEFFANPIVYEGLDENREKDFEYSVLDVFGISVGYSVPFAEIWSFSTGLQVRFQGPGSLVNTTTGTGPILGADVDYNTIRAWKENFLCGLELRWDNTISVNIGGIGLYAGVRWDIDNIVSQVDLSSIGMGNVEGNQGNIVHDLRLRAGVSYAFDFSGL